MFQEENKYWKESLLLQYLTHLGLNFINMLLLSLSLPFSFYFQSVWRFLFAGPLPHSFHCGPLMTSLSQTLRFKVYITFHSSRALFVDFRRKTVTENKENWKSVCFMWTTIKKVKFLSLKWPRPWDILRK